MRPSGATNVPGCQPTLAHACTRTDTNIQGMAQTQKARHKPPHTCRWADNTPQSPQQSQLPFTVLHTHRYTTSQPGPTGTHKDQQARPPPRLSQLPDTPYKSTPPLICFQTPGTSPWALASLFPLLPSLRPPHPLPREFAEIPPAPEASQSHPHPTEPTTLLPSGLPSKASSIPPCPRRSPPPTTREAPVAGGKGLSSSPRPLSTGGNSCLLNCC